MEVPSSNFEVLSLHVPDFKEAVATQDPTIVDRVSGELLEDQEKFISFVEKYDLQPIASQQIAENLTMHYSRVFTNESGRQYAIGYSDNGQSVHPFMYYQSRSQGVWRWLPAIDTTIRATTSRLYHKGNYEPVILYYQGEEDEIYERWCEEGLTVPVAMQKTFSALASDSAEIDGEIIDKLEETMVPDAKSSNDGTREDKMHPLISLEKGFKRQLVGFGSLPEMEASVVRWESDSNVYGIIVADVFISEDGNYLYGMAHNRDGALWGLIVEPIHSPLRINGLHDDVVCNAGELLVPAFEYGSQNWGNHKQNLQYPNDDYDKREGVDLKGSYERNVTALCEMPVLQEYLDLLPRENFAWANLIPATIRSNFDAYQSINKIRRLSKALDYSVGLDKSVVLDAACNVINSTSLENDTVKQAAETATNTLLYGAIEELKENYDRTTSRYISSDDQYTPRQVERVTQIVLDAFDLKAYKTVLEELDATIAYTYLASPVLPGITIILARKNDEIIDLDVKNDKTLVNESSE